MPITTLDHGTAVVVVDLQEGLRGFAFAHPIGEVVARTRILLDAFRDAGRTVALVNTDAIPPGRTDMPRPALDFPDGWTDLMPELGARPDEIRVTKRRWGALLGTDLETQLRTAGVTQIVLAGVATSKGVESTAREAHSRGLHVTLATDAMTDPEARAHAHSVSAVFPHLGETGSVAEIVGRLRGATG